MSNVEYRIEYLEGTSWRPHLRATGIDAARVAVGEMRDSTRYPWRIVKVTVIEEVVDS